MGKEADSGLFSQVATSVANQGLAIEDGQIFNPSQYHGILFAGDELRYGQTTGMPEELSVYQVWHDDSVSFLDRTEDFYRTDVVPELPKWLGKIGTLDDISTDTDVFDWGKVVSALGDLFVDREQEAYCMLFTGGGEIALSKVSQGSFDASTEGYSLTVTGNPKLSVVNTGKIQYLIDDMKVAVDHVDEKQSLSAYQDKDATFFIRSLVGDTKLQLVGLSENVMCFQQAGVKGAYMFLFVPYRLK